MDMKEYGSLILFIGKVYASLLVAILVLAVVGVVASGSMLYLGYLLGH